MPTASAAGARCPTYTPVEGMVTALGAATAVGTGTACEGGGAILGIGTLFNCARDTASERGTSQGVRACCHTECGSRAGQQRTYDISRVSIVVLLSESQAGRVAHIVVPKRLLETCGLGFVECSGHCVPARCSLYQRQEGKGWIITRREREVQTFELTTGSRGGALGPEVERMHARERTA
jgi:hypothetical protein